MKKSAYLSAISMIGLFLITVFSSPIFAESNYEVVKEAPMTRLNGYQTVNFDDNTSYSGYFQNGHPKPGAAVLIKDGKTISGYAKAIGGDQVILKFKGGSVRLKVVSR